MNRTIFAFTLAALAVAVLGGCSSKPTTRESKKVAPRDKIQGKTQVMQEPTVAEAAMNAGGPTVYLLDGLQRYRLFFNTAIEVVPGKEYAAEGVYAQKAIDEIGDPDQGKNGYPLAESCARVVNMTWSGLALDVADGYAGTLCSKLKRYPARPVFLVTRLEAVEGSGSADAKKKDAASEEKDVPEASVPADKQSTFLTESPKALTAPLWQPEGGTVRCKVLINTDGKISDLETGNQLCEAVPWSQYRYQPPVQRGHPVKVRTEVEVRFEPRK